MNAQASGWRATAVIVPLFAWAGLACAQGGIDVGERLGTGATALMLAVVTAAVGAGAAVWLTRDLAAWRSRPTQLVISGFVGLVLWSALSTQWSPQPHLSWLEANQVALALSCLLIAVGIGGRLAPSGHQIGCAVAATAAIPVIAALGIEALPGLFGSDFDPGRLAQPTGYHNALGLFAAAGIVGLATTRPQRRFAFAGLAAATTLFVTVLGLTLSRGAVLALVVALLTLAVVVGVGRIPVVAMLCGGLAASAPLAYGLSQEVLTDERVAVAAREDAGLGLGLIFLAAALLAAIVGALVGGRFRGGGALALVVVALLLVPVGATTRAEAGGGGAPGTSAIDNTPQRALSLASNNRDAWWGEAVRGWQAAPIVGNGAGSFRMVHLRERRDDSSLFIVRQPHQLVLKMLSDLGLIGLLLLLAWPVGVAWALLRRRDAAARVAPAAAVVVAFFVQAQLDWTFSIPSVAALAAAMTGLVLAGAAPGQASHSGRSDGPLAALTLVFVCVLALSAVLPWLSLREVAAAERAGVEGDTAGALQHAERAAALNPLSPRPLEEESFVHFAAGDVARAAVSRRALTDLQPDNPFAWAGLAVLLRGEAADTAWMRVLELDPMNRDARRALSGG